MDLVARARLGDHDALVYVFDNVFYDVYHEVLLATRDRRQAERVTREALDQLPGLLRKSHFGSVRDLRDALVRRAHTSISRSREAGASVSGMENLRAGIRHFVLISAAFIAAAGALILAI